MSSDKTRVTRLSIGRVYNLGNYEHVRYEVSVDVASSDSASSVLGTLEAIIADLQPIERTSVRSEAEIKRLSDEVAKMATMDEETWARYYGHCTGTRVEVEGRYAEHLAQAMRERAAAVSKREAAKDTLDTLGGSTRYTDAKERWRDDD